MIIDKASSFGLKEKQTDEAETGFAYKNIDRYLISGKLARIEIKNKIEAVVNRSWYKRSHPLNPPAI